ncbi:hypothetical protein V6Z11_D10G117800 [Gossypium hirsutum]
MNIIKGGWFGPPTPYRYREEFFFQTNRVGGPPSPKIRRTKSIINQSRGS